MHVAQSVKMYLIFLLLHKLKRAISACLAYLM